jgi:hypothetical protein
MKAIVTGTFAALVLGAAVASSQTPPAAQTPSPKPAAPPAGQTQPSGQEQRSATTKSQTTTYRGVLKGSDASGWTITPITTRGASSSTAGATATAGGASDTLTYSVVVAEGSKTNLSSMADQCVEIAGVVGPDAAGAARTSPGAGSPGAGAAGQAAAGAAKRVLTVTTIKEVEGGCKQ